MIAENYRLISTIFWWSFTLLYFSLWGDSLEYLHKTLLFIRATSILINSLLVPSKWRIVENYLLLLVYIFPLNTETSTIVPNVCAWLSWKSPGHLSYKKSEKSGRVPMCEYSSIHLCVLFSADLFVDYDSVYMLNPQYLTYIIDINVHRLLDIS